MMLAPGLRSMASPARSEKGTAGGEVVMDVVGGARRYVLRRSAATLELVREEGKSEALLWTSKKSQAILSSHVASPVLSVMNLDDDKESDVVFLFSEDEGSGGQGTKWRRWLLVFMDGRADLVAKVGLSEADVYDYEDGTRGTVDDETKPPMIRDALVFVRRATARQNGAILIWAREADGEVSGRGCTASLYGVSGDAVVEDEQNGDTCERVFWILRQGRWEVLS